MIYNVLVNLSQSLRGFWQFWSLGGFGFMVLTLSSPDRANFFYDSDYNNELSAKATDEEKITAKRRKITYSEILTYALPTSPKVVEFNNLIDEIFISQQQTSLIERDDSKTAEAMILLANILHEHWQDFPLKVKVLLLNKLKVFRKSFWKYFLTSIPNTFRTIKGRVDYYKGFLAELRTYDSVTQNNIVNKVSRDSKLLQNAWLTLKTTTLKIFKSDGYLLEENRESISEFTNSVKIMIAGQKVMNKYSGTLKELAKYENHQDFHVLERTPEETSEGLRKMTKLFKQQQDLWNSMTEEEREISNSEFLIRHEELSRSRSE